MSDLDLFLLLCLMSAMGATVGAVRLPQSRVRGKGTRESYIELFNTAPELAFSGASLMTKLAGSLVPDLITQ